MAEHKVQGSNMLLFIDPNGGTTYDMIVCLTSVGVSMSVQPIDASSACGPDKSPGAIDISYTFEGQHLQDPNTLRISGTDMRLLLNAEQTIGWKLSPETPVTGDEIQEGKGFISQLSSTYAFDSVGVFSGAIMPYGVPTVTIFGGGGGGLVLGQFYQGGNIAYLDGSGLHGFVVYNSGQSVSYDTWAIAYTVTGATGYAIGDGDPNTTAIIASVPSLPALACRNGNFNGYTDWVMPSINEMYNVILNQAYYSTPLSAAYYQTSTELSSTQNYNMNTAINGQYALDKLIPGDCVAIRYF